MVSGDEELSWKARGACRQVDPNVFFPEAGDPNLDVAREICRSCPVRLECLDFAVSEGISHGVWGGASERERRRIRRLKRRVQDT